jgi:hypothetical protein
MNLSLRMNTMLAGACALALASAAHAASLTLDDSVPGELTISWNGFEGGGSVNGGSAPMSGSKVVAGETADFSGTWIAANPATQSPGVIYIVDPGQPDLIRARIDGSWSTNSGFPTINITITSAPFGQDLGTLPIAFSGLGVPMPDGSIGVAAQFRNPTKTALVSIPSNLGINYVGDLVPECPEPVLFAQPMDNSRGAGFADADPTGTSSQFVENVTFAQAVRVRSLRWWGAYASTDTIQADADDFTLFVYSDIAGAPSDDPMLTIPLSQAVRAGTGLTNGGGRQIFTYAASLPASIEFKANAVYWISILNNTVNDTDDNWAWQQASEVDNSFNRDLNPTSAWDALPGDYSLELCGDVLTADCPADFDDSAAVDGADLAALLAAWGPCEVALVSRLPDDSLAAFYADVDSTGIDYDQADRVQPVSDTTFGAMRWWGVYASTGTVQADADDFTLHLYLDESGDPAEFPALSIPMVPSRVDTGLTNSGGRPIYEYEAALPMAITLIAGATYYVSISNNTVNDPDDNWAWQGSTDENNARHWRGIAGSGAWSTESPDLAFELLTTCKPDLNRNGGVAGADLAALLARWGACPMR